MLRRPTLLLWLIAVSTATLSAQPRNSNLTFQDYAQRASELSSRARANIYFVNQQSIFRGVQVNFVNVGAGNLTFQRRDMVVNGRIPLVLSRVYDSTNTGTPDFGPGWQLSAAESISVENGRAKLFTETGSTIDFIQTGKNTFALERDAPSDYSILSMGGSSTLTAVLRTGFVKQYSLIAGRFRLVKVTDRNGNEIRLKYEGGMLTRFDGPNHFVALARGKDGRILFAQDDQNRRVTYHYDGKGRLAEVIDLGGRNWQYSYTEQNQMSGATDPLNRPSFSALFDSAGRIQRLLLPSGAVEFVYDPSQHTTTVVDRKKLISHFFQNNEGITTRVVNSLGEETAISLDVHRNVESLSRNGSVQERMEYDPQHRLVSRRSTVGPEQVEFHYRYDPATGSLSNIRSGNSQDESFEYDAGGNVITARNKDGESKFEYSDAGDLVSAIWGDSKLLFTPTKDGLIGAVSEGGRAPGRRMVYNVGGQLTESVLSTGMSAHYEYLSSGLRSKTSYRDGRRVEYSYDPAGNLVATNVFDTKGKQSNGQKLETDDSYRLVRRVLFDGTETRFQYDPNGNLTEIKSGQSTTRFEYDSLDRLKVVITPTGSRLVYSYKPGERSVIEQHEHSMITVADLRDTGFTFSDPQQTSATRPVTTPFGSVRFSESLGTFQLSNGDGSEIVRPQERIEAALTKLHLKPDGSSAQARVMGFDIPFNAMFIPSEYVSINCCPECYFDGDGWYCPPCLLPPPPSLPDHLMVLTDFTQTLHCASATKQRDIVYAVVDFSDQQVFENVFLHREQFDSVSPNTCGNPIRLATSCSLGDSVFVIHDQLTVGCNFVGGSCGLTLTNQRWFLCDQLGPGIDQPIGSPGTIVGHNDQILVGGLPIFIFGTDIFP